MYSLWRSTLAQNHQLPSGDYAVAQGMFFRAYQRHQRNTIRIEYERAVNGAQRNTSTAKVHNLSCKRVPRDSSLTATKISCNQTQTGLPTKSPSRMLHRKTAFTKFFSFASNTFNVSLLQALTKPTFLFTKAPTNKGMKRSGQQDLNTCIGGLKKGQVPFSKEPFTPIFP